MQKFFLFFVKKLLTKFLSHSIISNVSGTRQNTKEYARVAQLVEHDLAKVGAAGSSPVSRSFYLWLTPCKCGFCKGFSLFCILFLPRHRHCRSNPETCHLISEFSIFISELLSII
mgnify:CR=1 FL=1